MFGKIVLALACAVGAVDTASATVVYKLQETFQSGTKFNGQVTFSDDLKDVTAVSGFYGNLDINWVWFDETTVSHHSQSYGNNVYYDYLMAGTRPSYTDFLTFTWEVKGSDIALSSMGDGNSANYFDNAVTGSIAPANDVPEPASLTLLGLGLAGVAALRRKQ